MTVRVNKPAVNLREKLAELDLPNHGKLNVNDDGDLNVRGKVNGTGAATFGSVSADTLTATTTLSANSISTTGGDVSFTDGTGTTPKFHWDASAESLGIGTSSPVSTVELANSDQAAGSTLSITNSFTGADWNTNDLIGTINFRTNDTSTLQPVRGSIRSIVENTSGATSPAYTALSFSTASVNTLAERMRIDSSGNLLVGKTVADNVTQGIRLLGSAGFASFVRSGAEPIVVNRLTDDGDIIDFRKDSATVGSIGSVGGDAYYAGSVRGVRFDSTQVIPCNEAGAPRDADTNLGATDSRFKDLYLSGGVYLGTDTAEGATRYTSRRHNDGGGGAIFATQVSGKAQMGELYAYDTSNGNWCHYSLKKDDQNSGVQNQQISGTGLTIQAQNSGGTIAMSTTGTSVKMVVTIIVVEN